jgi:hypothetical protein
LDRLFTTHSEVDVLQTALGVQKGLLASKYLKPNAKYYQMVYTQNEAVARRQDGLPRRDAEMAISAMVVILAKAEDQMAYDFLMVEARAIKTVIDGIAYKLERSVSLLTVLEDKRKRREVSCFTLNRRIDSVAGDALLAAALLSITGAIYAFFRKSLLRDLSHRSGELGD